jgi:predicted TIM-barrel fold metal-dependent hydrolase
MSDRRVIDCDVHCTVPSNDALYPYMEEHWREWWEKGTYRGRPSNAIGIAYPSWSPMTGGAGGELTLERVQSEVLSRSETAILHCYHGVESFTHPYLAASTATAVNKWIAAEWLDRDDRLLASAVVTPQYIEAAIAEIERIARDPRFVQILVPARSQGGYGNQRYWPLWEAAARHGLAVAITFGGASGIPPTPVNWPGSFFEEYATAPLAFQAHVMSLAVSGVFDRIPELRFVVSESGWTWLPACMWRIDQEWRAFHREVPWMTGPPTSYIRRHFRFVSQPIDAPPDAKHLEYVLQHLGSDELLMFGSDFPHAYPNGVEDLLALMSEEQGDRLMGGNAVAWYDLERSAAPASR